MEVNAVLEACWNRIGLELYLIFGDFYFSNCQYFYFPEKNWHMWIPGFGTEELKPYKRAPTTEAHKQRLALLRKAVKKY